MFYYQLNSKILQVNKCVVCNYIRNYYGGILTRNYKPYINLNSVKHDITRANLNKIHLLGIQNFRHKLPEISSNRIRRREKDTGNQAIIVDKLISFNNSSISQEDYTVVKNDHENINDLKNNSNTLIDLGKQQKVTYSDIAKLNKLFPNPKFSLNQVFFTLSQHFNDNSYKMHYKFTASKPKAGNNQWECSFTLKWPVEMKFSAIGTSQKAACTRATLQALEKLYGNGFITEKSMPVLPKSKSDKENEAQIKQKEVVLQPEIMTNMEKIVEDYEKKMLPHLTKYQDYDTLESNEVEGEVQNIQESWPLAINDSKVKFKGVEYYSCREMKQLPISNYKEDIINLVQSNQVVIIKGEPGCGKSTRVPQYILEAWARDYKSKETSAYNNCRIVVTQPRRVAAISLAERVSNERNELIGPTVGYQVRLKSRFDQRNGKILYCTSGILLRRLQFDQGLMDCSHVILDEAHERDVNTDLLLNLLKAAMKKNPNLKVLIMSATIKAEVFQSYFKEAAIIHIPGFTYPVSVNFLNSKSQMDATYTMANEGKSPNVNHKEIADFLGKLHQTKPKGAILVFLPGWHDITQVKNLILNANYNMEILCLHSRMPDNEQSKIFKKYPDNIRKVILATNIAETSVTIDDVVYVVDSGIVKENRFDAEKGITVIDNHWISKASMAQRKGRAGRVQPGEAFLLYPESKFKEFSDYSTPEIQRTSLTKIVLDSKVYSNNMKATEFLEQLITPPESNAITNAVEELTDLDLLDANENLTHLGRAISDFQLEPKLAKALVNSVIYKCVTPVVDIVTYFSAEMEVFAGGLIEKNRIKKTKMEFSQSSDHLSMMRLFEKWLELFESGNNFEAEDFCIENYLLPEKLRTLQLLRNIHFGYLQNGLHDILPISDDNSDNNELVKAVLLSGLGTVLQCRMVEGGGGKRKKNKFSLFTRHNQRVSLSSESVNSSREIYPTNYLLYVNETRSNIRRNTVIRETSFVTPLTVLLFKNNPIVIDSIKPNEVGSESLEHPVLVKLEGTRISFIMEHQQALVLCKCKDAISASVDYYIYQLTKGAEHDRNLNQMWDEMLNSLKECLSSAAKNIAF